MIGKNEENKKVLKGDKVFLLILLIVIAILLLIFINKVNNSTKSIDEISKNELETVHNTNNKNGIISQQQFINISKKYGLDTIDLTDTAAPDAQNDFVSQIATKDNDNYSFIYYHLSSIDIAKEKYRIWKSNYNKAEQHETNGNEFDKTTLTGVSNDGDSYIIIYRENEYMIIAHLFEANKKSEFNDIIKEMGINN